MRAIPLLLIGDASNAEFFRVTRDLTARPETRSCRDANAARSSLQAGAFSPELVVALQSQSGEYAAADLAWIQQAAPLARILIVYGAWCEGDPRAGKPGMGRIEIAAHRWPQWWTIQQDHVANGRSPAWAWPVTRSFEEGQWALEPAVVPSPRVPQTAGILTHDRTTAEALSEACRGRGYSVQILSSPSDALACDFVLWTVTGSDARETNGLAGRPWIALMDFPRAADCERLLSLGAAAVLARPFDLEELFWRIAQLPAANN